MHQPDQGDEDRENPGGDPVNIVCRKHRGLPGNGTIDLSERRVLAEIQPAETRRRIARERCFGAQMFDEPAVVRRRAPVPERRREYGAKLAAVRRAKFSKPVANGTSSGHHPSTAMTSNGENKAAMPAPDNHCRAAMVVKSAPVAHCARRKPQIVKKMIFGSLMLLSSSMER